MVQENIQWPFHHQNIWWCQYACKCTQNWVFLTRLPGNHIIKCSKITMEKIVCAVVASGHPRHEPSDLSSSDEGMLQNYQNLVPWNETAISILMLIPWFRSSCAWVVSNHVFKSISRDMTRAHNSKTSFSSKSDNNLLAWFPLIPIGILPDSLECPCYD